MKKSTLCCFIVALCMVSCNNDNAEITGVCIGVNRSDWTPFDCEIVTKTACDGMNEERVDDLEWVWEERYGCNAPGGCRIGKASNVSVQWDECFGYVTEWECVFYFESKQGEGYDRYEFKEAEWCEE